MRCDLLMRSATQTKAPMALEVGVGENISNAEIEVLVEMIRAVFPSLRMTLRNGEKGDLWLSSEEQCGSTERFFPLWSDPYVLAVATQDKRAVRAGALLGELKARDLITCPSHPSYEVLRAFHDISPDDEPAAKAESFALALNLVSVGIGLAYAPQTMVSQQHGLIGLSIPGLVLTHNVGLCVPAASEGNAAVTELIERLNARARYVAG